MSEFCKWAVDKFSTSKNRVHFNEESMDNWQMLVDMQANWACLLGERGPVML